MASPASIQFRGSEKVLDAYHKRKLAPWALFHRSQMIHPYDGDSLSEGEQLLGQLLEQLAEDGGNAVYTLKLYEKAPAGGIMSNTPDRGSFNFTIGDEEKSSIGSVGLRNELKALHLRLDQMNESKSSGDDRLGFIREVLELPGVAEALPVLIGKVFGDKAKTILSGVQGAITSEPQPVAAVPLREHDEFNNRIDDALDVIAPVVPDIDKALQKLADVAKRDPAKLKNLVSMIDLL